MGIDLLFELGMEEVPSEPLKSMLRQVEQNVKKYLSLYNIEYKKSQVLATPRRIVLFIENCSETQKDSALEVKGPPKKAAFDSEGKPTKAADGFSKSQKIKVTDLVIKEVGGGEYVFAIKKEKGKETFSLLPEILKKVVLDIKFSKAMRWDEGHTRFIRPIRWMLALWGNKIIPIKIDTIKSSDKTYGHRFLSEKTIKIKNASGYFNKIKENNVVVDQKERAKIIKKEALAVTKGIGSPLIHQKVMDEVVNLVEFPNCILGSYSKKYLSLPKDVLITVLEHYQRYFPVVDEKKRLLPNFIVISNGDKGEKKRIRKGNERVIKARLADAEFFYSEDLKKSLSSRVEDLSGIIFQKELGDLRKKIERIKKLGVYTCKLLDCKEDTVKVVKRASHLSKADLLTEMVYEFPELQGAIGKEYAKKTGESKEVAQAIFEHYLPRQKDDILPQTLAGQIISIADKIDTITGYFIVGLIPTGSEDPYSLRRQGQGINLIVMKNKLRLNLEELIKFSLNLYQKSISRNFQKEDKFRELMEFFKNRMRRYFKNLSYEHDLIEAIVSVDFTNMYSLQERIEVLKRMKEKEKNWDDLMTPYTRCKNLSNLILGNLVKKDLLLEKEEKILFDQLQKAEYDVIEAFKKSNYSKILKIYTGLRKYIDDYFDEVLVMCEDKKLQENRIRLLNRIVEVFLKFADFSKIVF